MTAAELTAFVADIRAQADAALARLDTVDLTELSTDLRAEYDAVHQGWEVLRKMTEADVLALHEAACIKAGRTLTPEELRGMVSRQ